MKEKLRELQTEKSMWTDSLMRNSNGKKATAVLALLFMVSLNMNSLTEIYKYVSLTCSYLIFSSSLFTVFYIQFIIINNLFYQFW